MQISLAPRDPSVTSPLWETWEMDGMIGRIVVNGEIGVAQLDKRLKE